MSSLNIISWTPEDIANWIKGLDSSLEQYIPNFLAHSVTGDRLLKMTIQELEDMKITKMGHQELMLEAIDLLLMVHYAHPTETLQTVALNLNTKASNLASLLKQRLQSGNHPQDRLYSAPSTILLKVSETISAAKTLISWLDRPPFSTGPEKDFQEFSKDILHYALEMTQAVQLHHNLAEALPEIRAIAKEFAAIADNLIKQSTDPLVIQPTTVEEVRIKKSRPEEELGLFIKTSTIDGIHYITGTKDQSAASLSRKVGPGDELLRVNEQTVVSWEHSKVVTALKHDPMGVCLTLRKRPCNLGSPGQVIRPGNSPYTIRHGGTPQLMRKDSKDSFPSMRSPITTGEFLMPMSPHDVLITKQRSNSDPETQKEAHETHSDSESLVQEAERIKRQRRGTMGEGLQRKGSKGQTPEGRPRSLPINTEELVAEVAKWTAPSISARPDFSPIAGSPSSPATASTQTSPLLGGDKTPNRTTNPKDAPPVPAKPSLKKVSISTTDGSSPSRTDALDSPSILVRPEFEISKPTEDENSQDPAVLDETERSSEADQKSPKDPEKTPVTTPDTEPESTAKNTNNNVDASMAGNQQEVTNEVSGVATSDIDDYVLVENKSPLSPSKSSGVRLRPKKTKRKYKVSRGVSCVDLGPGECQGWLHKKNETKQTFRSNWVEMWFVLKDFVLYYYKNKTDTKAKGVLCLPGYLVSEASESKRENAFKASHKGTKPIYFAAHRRQDMEKWIRKLGLAAIMYADEKRMRQSVIFESEPSLNVSAMMQSVDGYHSESDDEDKSDKSSPVSPTSSDKSDESSSGSPQHKHKYRRTQTAPDLLSGGSGSPTPIPKSYLKNKKESGIASPNSPKGSPKIMQRVLQTIRRHSRGNLNIQPSELAGLQGKFATRRNSSPFVLISHVDQPSDEAFGQVQTDETPTFTHSSPTSPDATNGRPIEGATVHNNDDLLNHYMTLVEDTGGVSGLERTMEARTSKRFKAKGPGLKRIHTVLDKNPEKNKKALQRRALQRTLKAKEEELQQLNSLLSEASVSSTNLQEWRKSHKDLLDHILKGPKPDSPSDSDSDMDEDKNLDKVVNGNLDGESAGANDDVSEDANGNRDTVCATPDGTQVVAGRDSDVTTEDCRSVENLDKEKPSASASGQLGESSEMAPSTAESEVSGMARSSHDEFRKSIGSQGSETSL
ncbi:CNK3/IPCEF1 fusion protein-like isoform X3 [Patiria miniata]|uniref:Connector enhancer of kinase suppressor of ras 2-like n=1 Tax=Patiria miniata TaxID=46514 RepID=A0A913ZB08_PATMI|nr:CNK3/IPCEF1 fusion protein-like isoform X3 [Patiria miniata]